MTFERLLVVLTVIAVAVILAAIQNRGVAVTRRRRAFEGVSPGLAVFASRTCQSCESIEAMVADAAGSENRRVYWWDESPEIFERNGIERVPAIARVGEDGSGWIAVGVPSAARLRRWLRGP